MYNVHGGKVKDEELWDGIHLAHEVTEGPVHVMVGKAQKYFEIVNTDH